MPDPHRVAGELCEILQDKRYASLLARAHRTAWQFASEAAQILFKTNALTGEVTVAALKGPFQLYRAYDGISHHTGLTLGSFWCDRALVQDIWSAVSKVSPEIKRDVFFGFLRSALFIHPQWNLMTDIACLTLPVGDTLPVFKGRGDWRALRAASTMTIRNQQDVSTLLGWMAMPGPHQYMIPCCGSGKNRIWAFNDMWIRKVRQLESTWPFAPAYSLQSSTLNSAGRAQAGRQRLRQSSTK